MKYLYIDTETGGLDPTTNALLTIGLVAHDDVRGILGEQEIKVAPEAYTVHEQALKVNGIELAAHCVTAVPREYAAKQVVNFVTTHFGMNWNTRPVYVGHNVKFDTGFMDQLWKDTGVKQPYHYYSMCTMQIALFMRDLGLIDPGDFKLATLLEEYGITNTNAHTSLGDALATRELHLEMRRHAKLHHLAGE